MITAGQREWRRRGAAIRDRKARQQREEIKSQSQGIGLLILMPRTAAPDQIAAFVSEILADPAFSDMEVFFGLGDGDAPVVEFAGPVAAARTIEKYIDNLFRECGFDPGF